MFMIFVRLVSAFVTAACFCYLFKGPNKDIFHCGITGLLGWLMLEFVGLLNGGTSDVFWATVTVAGVSLYFAHTRKTITTIYLVTGIIPYVPGGAIYRTMYNLVFHMTDEAAAAGLGAFLSAGSIALGIITVLSLHKLYRQFRGYYYRKKSQSPN